MVVFSEIKIATYQEVQQMDKKKKVIVAKPSVLLRAYRGDKEFQEDKEYVRR